MQKLSYLWLCVDGNDCEAIYIGCCFCGKFGNEWLSYEHIIRVWIDTAFLHRNFGSSVDKTILLLLIVSANSGRKFNFVVVSSIFFVDCFYEVADSLLRCVNNLLKHDDVKLQDYPNCQSCFIYVVVVNNNTYPIYPQYCYLSSLQFQTSSH